MMTWALYLAVNTLHRAVWRRIERRQREPGMVDKWEAWNAKSSFSLLLDRKATSISLFGLIVERANCPMVLLAYGEEHGR
jgi:hypothetical protein